MRGVFQSLFPIWTAFVLLICACPVDADAIPFISAYQELYRMDFEVRTQYGLPSGWYVTFDGYPVAQIRPNHWVYGKVEPYGLLAHTDVAVGSVVPMEDHRLARVALSSWHSGAYETKAFRAIARSGLDNMGVLDDPLAYTPVAWKSGEAGLRIWLGDQWHTVSPMGGQTTSQALINQHPFIVRTLDKKNAIWTMSDTQELADLARDWGYIWRGRIPFASLSGYRDTGSDGSSAMGIAAGSGGSSGGSLPDAGGGGQWDIGGGSGGGTSGGGGGWDAGGGVTGGGSGSTGGGGWDAGGGATGGGGTGGGGTGGGGTGAGGGGNGWDK